MGTVTTLPHGHAFTRDARAVAETPADGFSPRSAPRCQPPGGSRGADGSAGRSPGRRPVLQPDLLVARRSDFTEKDLPVAPLLAVEILSPSTRRLDLTLQRSRYESAGCPSYWVLDPDTPALTAWALRDEVYVESANVAGDQEFTTEAPFAVSFSPSQLLA